MKIIIVGVGKLGEYIAHELVNENHEVTLIDINFKNHNNIINNEDLNYICGNGLDSNTLIEAGITDTDILISVMEKDEQNVMCIDILFVRAEGAKHYVMAANKDNIIEKRYVKVGRTMYSSVEIISGLSEDDRIANAYGKTNPERRRGWIWHIVCVQNFIILIKNKRYK